MTVISYVGQTKKQLRTRIKEHYNNIKSDKLKHSVILKHMLNCNHSFDWNNVNILDSEPNYNKRLISEMLILKNILENNLTVLIHKKTQNALMIRTTIVY